MLGILVRLCKNLVLWLVVLVRVLLLGRYNMTRATLIKKFVFIGSGLRFRGLVHYHHGRKHGSMQADMVLEEPRVQHLDPQATKGDYESH